MQCLHVGCQYWKFSLKCWIVYKSVFLHYGSTEEYNGFSWIHILWKQEIQWFNCEKFPEILVNIAIQVCSLIEHLMKQNSWDIKWSRRPTKLDSEKLVITAEVSTRGKYQVCNKQSKKNWNFTHINNNNAEIEASRQFTVNNATEILFKWKLLIFLMLSFLAVRQFYLSD